MYYRQNAGGIPLCGLIRLTLLEPRSMPSCCLGWLAGTWYRLENPCPWRP